MEGPGDHSLSFWPTGAVVFALCGDRSDRHRRRPPSLAPCLPAPRWRGGWPRPASRREVLSAGHRPPPEIIRDYFFGDTVEYAPEVAGFEVWVSVVVIVGLVALVMVRPLSLPEAGVTDTIVVENLSKWFGLKVAVSELSIGFRPGVTGLLGPNGAGKTTLLRSWPASGRPRGSEDPRDRPAAGHRDLPQDLAGPGGRVGL